MKVLNYVACGNYFVAISSELLNVEIYKVLLFTDGSVKYNTRCNGRDITIPNKTKFYDSIDSFKKGHAKEPTYINERDVCSFLKCRHIEGNKFVGWVFGNEIAEEITFTVESITIADNRITSISGTDQYGMEIPQKFYRDRQDVLNNNVVKVVDEQGNVSEMVGINVKIRLDEDQQAMDNELKDLIEKMRASGMAIVYDDINATISAINTRNIGGVHTYCLCGDEDFEYELDYEDMITIVPIDSRVDDSYILGVDKKD